MTKSLATAPTVALVVTLALLAFSAAGQHHTALAQGPPLVMGIDPQTTGNTCAASPADCTLGTVEPCYEVTCPSTECTWDGTSSFDDVSDYVIDVYIDDPAGTAPAPIDYNAWVFYDQSIVQIADPGTDGKVKMPGADISTGEETGGLPDSDGDFLGGWMFLWQTPILGVNTYIGDGPLLRLGLDIGASGVVTFSLDAGASTYSSLEATPHPLTLGSARLAINDSCALPPVGGTAELPSLSHSRHRQYMLLSALTAAAALALVAGGWYTRRR